ncbi:hypothetical protein RAS1_16510 [Phycisphaerae bacterium RAS1]|nr:hypothetical protein RAS1_16510 [Phycisphaerae bacterium RAS1]
MPEFISEPIEPAGAPDATAMARGEPGLPPAFHWRSSRYGVCACLETWKFSSREGARAGGELYLRRHYYRLRMSDGREWTVYFIRQGPRSGSAKRRWFLYEIADNQAT